MDRSLIENWNSTVGPDDIIWHLGDFALGGNLQVTESILKRLNGRKFLVIGNHDNMIRNQFLKYFENGRDLLNKNKYFYNIQEITVIDEDRRNKKQKLVLSHFPLLSWHHMSRGVWHIHGHCHSSLNYLNENTTRLDIGVDNPWSNYYPISYREVANILSKKQTQLVDHHGRTDEKQM